MIIINYVHCLLQMVVFGYDCLSQGEIIHEVMHQLGFSHEHTRPDRDQYITILWNNIKPGTLFLLLLFKVSLNECVFFFAQKQQLWDQYRSLKKNWLPGTIAPIS